MKNMSFPLSEHSSIKERLDRTGSVWTTRVSNEKSKYDKGDQVMTPWGVLNVVESKDYNTVDDHPFLDDLSAEQKMMLTTYGEYRVLRLEK